MVYKLGNVKDVDSVFGITDTARGVLLQQTKVLTTLYGEDRDIDNDDGGYVLWVEQGTKPEEIKAIFDYSLHIPEYVNIDDNIVSAIYLLHNEYVVVIVMSIDDVPYEIRKEIDNEKI